MISLLKLMQIVNTKSSFTRKVFFFPYDLTFIQLKDMGSPHSLVSKFHLIRKGLSKRINDEQVKANI